MLKLPLPSPIRFPELHPNSLQFSSVQFSHSVVSDSLQPHESQHARPPCPSPTPGVHPNSHPLSQWCHPAISSSVVPFSSCPTPSQHQSLFQESTLHMRWPKYWSFSFNISPSKEHPGLISFRMDWLDLLGGTLRTLSKNKTGSWLWLRSWAPYCQIQTNSLRTLLFEVTVFQ